jgi:hypothetical protein
MNDPYGQSPTHQWGQLEDDFKPPYTQDPVPGSPYPPYGQPNLSPAAAQSAAPAVQPVYVPYPVPMPGSQPGDGVALTSLILGIISVAIGWVPLCGLIALAPAIVGIVLGALGLKSQRRKWMAIGGIILSVVGFAAATLFIWI